MTTPEPVTDDDRAWLAEDPKRRLVRHREAGHLGWVYAGDTVPDEYDVVEGGAA